MFPDSFVFQIFFHFEALKYLSLCLNPLQACIDSQTKVLYKNAHFQPKK